MTGAVTAPCQCPRCGSVLTIDPDAVVVDRSPGAFWVPGRAWREIPRLAAVAFCMTCECGIEIGRKGGKWR